MVAEWTDFFERFDKEKYGSDGAPLHDPCTIAWLLEPEIFTGRHINVEIETVSELTRGMTVVDERNTVGTQDIFTDEWAVRHPNVLVHHELDAVKWKALLEQCLR